jgi:hypothetical protein
MQSSLIGKIEKAKRYSQDKGRVTFSGLTVKFRGDNDTYTTSFDGGKWRCSCHFYTTWGVCSHTMALERMLGDMLPQEALTVPDAAR